MADGADVGPASQTSVTGTAALTGSKSGRKSMAVYESPLPWLQGVWRGKGKGIFPTIKPFEWHEELSIHGNPSNPRPVLHYRQRTWSKHSNPKPMHEEQGWIRVLPMTHEETGGQRVEVVGAAQNGVSTIEEGYVRDGRTLVLRSTGIARSSTSRNPYALSFCRTIEVDTSCDPPQLHYTMDMSTTTVPELTRHLEAWLVKLHDASAGGTPTLLYASPSGAASPVGGGAFPPRLDSGSFTAHHFAAALSSSPASHHSHLHPGGGPPHSHLLLHHHHHHNHHHSAAGLPPRPASITALQGQGSGPLLAPRPSSNGTMLPPTPHLVHPHAPSHLHPLASSGTSPSAPSPSPALPPPLPGVLTVPAHLVLHGAGGGGASGTPSSAGSTPQHAGHASGGPFRGGGGGGGGGSVADEAPAVHAMGLLDQALQGLMLSNSVPADGGVRKDPADTRRRVVFAPGEAPGAAAEVAEAAAQVVAGLGVCPHAEAGGPGGEQADDEGELRACPAFS